MYEKQTRCTVKVKVQSYYKILNDKIARYIMAEKP